MSLHLSLLIGLLGTSRQSHLSRASPELFSRRKSSRVLKGASDAGSKRYIDNVLIRQHLDTQTIADTDSLNFINRHNTNKAGFPALNAEQLSSETLLWGLSCSQRQTAPTRPPWYFRSCLSNNGC
ncbi:uncharacterized protein B0I36DRAFT_313581 [Microdochium trichocladiopsis]|uniref:Uncharacterized protein n=1 Tax=Microdochium trichocladiopsis TaxID=1682393 RepID=A0A9P8YAT1_9PEZI|nr:uncharacterized protein B0I36DRAFT_313581 [Microdochium trichocladiopsis]KAH7037231.1 hypothetical protein B0I36DRAFT_313581 [Microdochium trichocladiopsis]